MKKFDLFVSFVLVAAVELAQAYENWMQPDMCEREEEVWRAAEERLNVAEEKFSLECKKANE